MNRIRRLIAWLLAGDRDCPYNCPRHYQAWVEWRTRRDRPGFRMEDYR